MTHPNAQHLLSSHATNSLKLERKSTVRVNGPKRLLEEKNLDEIVLRDCWTKTLSVVKRLTCRWTKKEK